MERTEPGRVTAVEREACPFGPGDVLARRYSVELSVGEGTYGWVLTAIDLEASPPQRVALKVLRPHYVAHEEASYRFERRELELLLRVHAMAPSPHVVRPLAPTPLQHEGLTFLVLEYIEGPSLREVMEGTTASPERARRLGAALARGLAAIHAAGGVHRDLKPTNVRLRGGSEPVIVDLGSTRALWETLARTGSGRAPMTPLYASPEQVAGREVGPASDLYSLGLVLCELLTGELPLPGRPLAPGRTVPGDMLALVKRCLEPSPEQRPTAIEVAAALSGPLQSPRRLTARQWGVWVAGVSLLALLGAAALLFSMHQGTGGSRVSALPAQPPDSDRPWSRSAGDASDQRYIRIAFSPGGDPFIAGAFRGTMDLGTGPMVSAGSIDAFLAALTPEGQAIWSRRFGDDDGQGIGGIAVDLEGNLLVMGNFRGKLDLGGQPLFNPAAANVFLARLTPDGRLLWSRQFEDGQEQVPIGIAADPEGNAVLAGHFEGSLDFGGGAHVSAGRADVFLARFTPDGRLLWSRGFGDAREQVVASLAVGKQGHIALAGRFEGALDFGDGPLVNPGEGEKDAFLALFDAGGRLLWSRQARGSRMWSVASAFDTEGNIIFVTSEEGEEAAEAGRLEVSLFALDGSLRWRRRIARTEGAMGVRLAVLPGGRLLLAGHVQGCADFGDGPFCGLGGLDVVVLELGADATLLRARRFGGAKDQYLIAVAVDPWGRVLLGGGFEGNVDFGSLPLSSAGGMDLFLARLESPRDTLPLPVASAEGDCTPEIPGLVGRYPLDEMDIGAVQGAAPRGFVTPGASATAGRGRGVLRLEGGFLEVPDDDALDFGLGAFSLSAWVRTTDIEGVKVLLDKRHQKGEEPVAGYSLYLQGGRVGFQLADGHGSPKCSMNAKSSCMNYLSGRFVADGAWHLVTVTAERDTPNGGSFYIDGQLASQFSPTHRHGSLDNDAPLRLGSRSSSESGLFRGLVDDVSLWSRALTASEVASLYRAGSAGLCRDAQPSGASRSP